MSQNSLYIGIEEFKNLISEKPFYVFDLEATGDAPPNDRIVQFAAFKVRMKDGDSEIEDSINFYINPGCKMSYVASKLTGITDEFLEKEGIPADEGIERIVAFWGNDPIIVGYGSKGFDERMLGGLYKENGRKFKPEFHLDLHQMACKVIEEKGRKLRDVAALAGTADKYEFHRADEDARATLDALMYLLPRYADPEPPNPAEAEPKAVKAKATAANVVRRPRIYITPDFAVIRIKRYNRNGLWVLDVENTQHKVCIYDLTRKKWRINADVSEEVLENALLKMYGVSSMKKLGKKNKLKQMVNTA